MASSTADVVICGAGIAGVSAAYQLAVRYGVGEVVLVEERPPLSLTSDKSTEAYRNWWPGPDDAMVRLMNRSIDILEELAEASDNRFLLNRRGYLWVTGDPSQVEELRSTSDLAVGYGAGELRTHTGGPSDPAYRQLDADRWEGQPEGADLILEHGMLRREFPYLTGDTCAALHTRRCGWFSGQQLGMELLERARDAGVRLVEGRVEDVLVEGGRIAGVRVEGAAAEQVLSTRRFVNAAGPFVQEIAALIGVDLPVFSELHLKASFEDTRGIVPRDAPLITWTDPQMLPWSEEERQILAEDDHTRWLTEEMPGGVHLRPEGAHHVLLLWPYDAAAVPESFPIEIPDEYGEICLRGITTAIPELAAYVDHLPRFYVDGGYYTKTRENRPLACPLPVEGAYLHGALSGFGLMASAATAELLAAHISGSALPDYAPAFDLRRYEDTEYLEKLENWGDTGQL
jgi:glycine/D-amino acid oxidase-like deaminating enzyme